MSLQPRQIYAFGPYTVDPASSQLLRGGASVPLPPKPFDLLLALVRQPGRVIPKAELMGALWPDAFVEDANLTQQVFTLRRALGNQGNGEPYIQTVPRRGYCFAAPVRELDGSPAAVEPAGERSPEPRKQSAAFIDGERKQATVLHCRVANAAALAERLGPGGLHELLSHLTEIAGEEIGRYDGIVRQGQADELVALFGARVVHEDDARRAAFAAVRLRDRLAAMAEKEAGDDERPRLRFGINTGPVVVSRHADDRGVEYSAVGETMRIADLLQQLAQPDTILISESARRAAEGYVLLEPVQIDRAVAGTAVFRILGIAPAAGWRTARLARSLARFVGRRHELALLEELAARAATGAGQVVSIVGEPGMGKSRLVHEFARAVHAVSWLEGRCVSYGSLIPYLPLGDLVRARCGVLDSDTPETMREAVDRTVRELVLPADTAPWLLRLIGIADGAGAHTALSPEAVKARTFEALRALLLTAGAAAPLVIVIEDVQWIDRTSEEFLTTVVERLVAARAMVVLTCRPGFRAPWLDRSYATQITLSPLNAADSAELVCSIDRDRRLTADSSATILSKAEGNPFFMEELARTVVDQGPDADGIPDTVHGVIMARLDRLPQSAKQLLQTASVLGREAPLRLLKSMWRDGAEIDADLVALSRLEFIYERAGGEEPVVVFKHALTQDVAYDSLLARRRRELHLDAARALETLYGDRLDDVTARLAYHYTRTDLLDEAVTWLIRAADQAARVYANAEAILHLELARRRLERLPESPARDRRTVDVALRHAHSLYFLGRFKESVEILLPHEARLVRLNDSAVGAAWSFWLAHMYSRLGDQRRAADNAERAIAEAERAGDVATSGKAHGLLALEGYWSGNTNDGIPHGEEAVRRLGPLPDQRWWLGMAHFYLAANHLLTGRFDAALAEAARADAVGKAIGDPRLQTYAGFTTGWIEASRGEHERAIAACRHSASQAPDRVSRAYATMFLGLALVEGGAHTEAEALLEPVVGELAEFGFPQWHSLAMALLAECRRVHGQRDDAAALVVQALQIATRAQYWYGVGVAHRIAARIAVDRHDAAEADRSLKLALDTFTRIDARFEIARSRTDLALLADRAAGDRGA
jgi:DNA-binding winged helix-turn-helix (wHTH) protein/tetratricopeptide (TPR) repeat protein